MRKSIHQERVAICVRTKQQNFQYESKTEELKEEMKPAIIVENFNTSLKIVERRHKIIKK